MAASFTARNFNVSVSKIHIGSRALPKSSSNPSCAVADRAWDTVSDAVFWASNGIGVRLVRSWSGTEQLWESSFRAQKAGFFAVSLNFQKGAITHLAANSATSVKYGWISVFQSAASLLTFAKFQRPVWAAVCGNIRKLSASARTHPPLLPKTPACSDQ